VTLSTSQAIAAAPAIAGQVLTSDFSPSVLQRGVFCKSRREGGGGRRGGGLLPAGLRSAYIW
jgi:hypothetical protein